ncbi:MAG: DUF2271 domain-containing protein [Dysgonamonadaceae bacterium]|jgi:hypothetical protein|nr:DUF2271 domain-containing protein [Dysgonamonadaceae bacterium]
MTVRLFSFLLLLSLLTVGCGKKSNATTDTANAVLKINVDYEKQPGHGSNQWAVWIEDNEGCIVKTLFVTRFTADGGYIPRPSCTPLWVSKALPDNLSQEAIDAFSGATPSSGIQTYVWDITDADGHAVAKGNYAIRVEATLYGESEVVYKAPISIGNKEWTLMLEPFYTSDDNTNRNMIRSVSADYLFDQR